MSFFDRLFNWIRGINEKNRPVVSAQQITPADFVFGTIVSGGYTNFKHDPTPTILCLGVYTKQNGFRYVHGIQLHAIGAYQNYLMSLLVNMFREQVAKMKDPRMKDESGTSVGYSTGFL